MKTNGGGLDQAFNAQAITDVDSRLNVGAFVAPNPTDVQQLEPALVLLTQLTDEDHD